MLRPWTIALYQAFAGTEIKKKELEDKPKQIQNLEEALKSPIENSLRNWTTHVFQK